MGLTQEGYLILSVTVCPIFKFLVQSSNQDEMGDVALAVDVDDYSTPPQHPTSTPSTPAEETSESCYVSVITLRM